MCVKYKNTKVMPSYMFYEAKALFTNQKLLDAIKTSPVFNSKK